MPEATGGGLTTQVSLLALQGWRWLVVDGTAAAAETAANGTAAAKAFYTLANEPIAAIHRQRAENKQQVTIVLTSAAAFVAASTFINLVK